jgi:hypothetical protein
MKKTILTLVTLFCLLILNSQTYAQDPCPHCTPDQLTLEFGKLTNLHGCTVFIRYEVSYCQSIPLFDIRILEIEYLNECLRENSDLMKDIIAKILDYSKNDIGQFDENFDPTVSYDVQIRLFACWRHETTFNPNRFILNPCEGTDCCIKKYTIYENQYGVVILDSDPILVQEHNPLLDCSSLGGIPGPSEEVCELICDGHLNNEDTGKPVWDNDDGNCDFYCYWKITGNYYIDENNFIGPTNGEDFIIKTGNKDLDGLKERMRIDADGKVVIGEKTIKDPFDEDLEDHTDYQLAVYGKIVTNEIVGLPSDDVEPGKNYWEEWPDFVFDENYNLSSLFELEKVIKENKHLPGIPTKEQAKKEGINILKMQAKLLQKIEELTLYMIELKKENEELRKKIEEK